MLGERAFAEWSGLLMDLESRAGGDAGIDFRAGAWTIDVKTAQRAYNLLLEVGKERACADILVLAQVCENPLGAKLLGWATREEIVRAPARDFGYRVRNHYIPQEELRPMSALEELLVGDLI